jgi:hypothetical protein
MSEVSPQPSVERYVELEQLGHGGMGSVHRVHDRDGGRCLALKRLNTSRSRNPAGLTEMFHQEFRTLSRLRHPHVVEVYDFGVDPRGPYYTMEWLDGEDLQALAPLPWREVCVLGRDICSALALLHSRRLIHRDASPRNIKRLRSGRAKLIDFGGMMAMDVARNTVGTAPLVAPEVMLRQPLDARTDLYALGGTLYFALTGQHAYPVRAIAELSVLWRTPPVPPSAYVNEIPAGLDHLVLSMLSLEPGARPRSAAEVVERLSALADLPADEQLAVSNAYLSTPELVGREAELSSVRARLGEMHARQGGVLWIGGDAGVGRSRILSAASLDAKLSGAYVLSARGDGSGVPYGVLRDLLTQAPPVPGFPLVRRVIEGELDADFDRRCRSDLWAELRDWVCRCALRAPLALAIDDIERADEPSAAALAALAHEAIDQPVLIMVACAVPPERLEAAALAVLADGATLLPLSPLRGEETRSLLGSMFGDVPNLGALAVRIHELAEGSPRGAVELAQYLVDEGSAKYQMGAWRLPPASVESSLPASLTRARRQRLQALSPLARRLAAALALADGSGLPASACLLLVGTADPHAARAALDELLASQIVQRDGLLYAFEAQVWSAELQRALSVEEKRVICRQIAGALTQHGRDALEVARYNWLAGDAPQLVETLLAELARGSRWDRCPREYAAMLASAAAACTTLGRTQREWYQLVRELVRVGQDLSVPDMREHLTALFGQLELDSGLIDARTLPAALAPIERVQRTLELAERRYVATPEHARCLSPFEAVEALTRLVSESAAFAAQIADARLFDVLPRLDVFVPLSEAVQHVQSEIVPAARDLVAGRFEAAQASHLRSLALFQSGGPAGFDADTRAWGIRVLHYALGCLDAAVGRSQAMEHASELERTPAWLVPAWTVRHIYHGAVGHARESDRCRKRIELLLLQTPVKPPLSAGAAQQHVYTASMCEDLTALRDCISEMTRLAAQQPTLRPFLDFARAEHARVCGDTLQAVELLAALGNQLLAGDYPLWTWVTGSWIRALSSLDRWEDALRLGVRSAAEAERAGLEGMRDFIEAPLALAEEKLGRREQARARMDRVVASREDGGFEGASLGWAYEMRARLAVWQRDEVSFEKYGILCRQQYRKTGGNPALAAKYESLVQEARSAGAPVTAELAAALTRSTSASAVETTHERDRELTARFSR